MTVIVVIGCAFLYPFIATLAYHQLKKSLHEVDAQMLCMLWPLFMPIFLGNLVTKKLNAPKLPRAKIHK